jgi:hypothetical protein
VSILKQLKLPEYIPRRGKMEILNQTPQSGFAFTEISVMPEA